MVFIRLGDCHIPVLNHLPPDELHRRNYHKSANAKYALCIVAAKVQHHIGCRPSIKNRYGSKERHNIDIPVLPGKHCGQIKNPNQHKESKNPQIDLHSYLIEDIWLNPCLLHERVNPVPFKLQGKSHYRILLLPHHHPRVAKRRKLQHVQNDREPSLYSRKTFCGLTLCLSFFPHFVPPPYTFP